MTRIGPPNTSRRNWRWPSRRRGGYPARAIRPSARIARTAMKNWNRIARRMGCAGIALRCARPEGGGADMAILASRVERLCGSRQGSGHPPFPPGRSTRALARGRQAACGAGVQDPGAVGAAAKMIMRGSRVMNPALGLRGLGMAGVSSGLHPAPFAGSQAGPRA